MDTSIELRPEKKRPTVSLVIMALNAEATIARTIKGVEEDIDELALVDSGSSDKTVEVVLDWGRRTGKPVFVSYFLPGTRPEAFIKDEAESFPGAPERLGPYTGLPLLADWASLRNFTLAQGRCDYVLMLDADDIWVKGRVSDMVRQMEHHQGDTMTTNYEYDNEGKICQGRNYTWRLFRRSSIGKIINFEGPTHESIVDMGKVLAASDVTVRDSKENVGLGVRVPNRAAKILWHYCAKQNFDWKKIDQRWHYYLAVESRSAIPEIALEWMNSYFLREDTVPSLRANMRLGLGDLYTALADYPAAVESFLAAAKEVEYPDPYFHAARAAYKHALEAEDPVVQKSRVQSVVSLLSKGLSLIEPRVNPVVLVNPALRPASYVLMADCLGFLGRFDEAISVSEKSLLMFPDADKSQIDIWKTCIKMSKEKLKLPDATDKPDLSDLTLVIAFALDCPERLENLRHVLDRFDGTRARILLIEQDKSSNLAKNSDLSEGQNNMSVMFFERQDGVFDRTKILNFGLRKTETPFVAIYDCDVIFNWPSIYSAMEILRNKKADFVYPYDGCFVDVARDKIPALLKGQPVSGNVENPYDGSFIDFHSYGGCFIASVKSYRKAGGENQNFVSWGPEDRERVLRFGSLGYKIARTGGSCFHMSHPRGTNSGPANPFFKQNNEEYLKVAARANDFAAMSAYVKTFPWYEELNSPDTTSEFALFSSRPSAPKR